MRAFVAVELPPLVLDTDAAHSRAPSHLTLAFLGELVAARLPAAVEACRAGVRGIPSFPVTVQGVGAFPDGERPRVVWAGVTTGAAELSNLAERVRAELMGRQIGFDRKPFVAHLTLFRVRRPSEVQRVRQTLTEMSGREFFSTKVNEVELKESVLTAGGAVHTTLERFPLNPAVERSRPAPGS